MPDTCLGMPVYSGSQHSPSHLDERVLHKAAGAGHWQVEFGRLLPGGAAHAALDAHLHVLLRWMGMRAT